MHKDSVQPVSTASSSFTVSVMVHPMMVALLESVGKQSPRVTTYFSAVWITQKKESTYRLLASKEYDGIAGNACKNEEQYTTEFWWVHRHELEYPSQLTCQFSCILSSLYSVRVHLLHCIFSWTRKTRSTLLQMCTEFVLVGRITSYHACIHF
jgi:hypothetical protein